MRHIAPIAIGLTTAALCMTATLATAADAPDSTEVSGRSASEALDDRLSRALHGEIRHSEMNERQCWEHVARVAAIPDSLELAAMYDPDVSDRMPAVDKWSRPSPSSIGRSDFRGMIVVDVLVDTFGQVASVCIVEGALSDMNRLVVEAAFKTRFVPGRKGGVAVPVWVRLPYRF